ncbi:MAG: sulfotransferase family protein [Saprospiraceae bacterium]
MGQPFQDKNINKTGVVSVVGATCSIWWKYLTENKWEWKYFGKILLVSLVVWIGIPFRIWERFRLKQKIKNTPIHPEPVFILGHWRGGTTLLHNLLTSDKRFAYVTYLQGLFPHAFLASGFFRWFAVKIMPSTRPMDNMKINTESPQEEELALISQSGHSLYNMWIAPEKHLDFWQKYGHFSDEKSKKNWDKGYTQLLKAATYNFEGKPLVLKNPPNTMRIPYLLEKFPNAKFVFICRNPYKVYASTYKLYRDVINFFQIQEEDEENVVNNILQIYREMNQKYLKDRYLIPKENLIEIKFEDFVKDKMGGLENIYEQLNLGDFETIRPTYQAYLDSIKSYKKNKLRTDDKVRKDVNANWGFAFDAFGYEKE